jgi:hypothetical protein
MELHMKKKSAKHADVINRNDDYVAKITAPGFDPVTVGLTPEDVTRISTKLDTAKTAFSGKNAAADTKKSKTGDFSGTGGALDQLMEERRLHDNKIRMSDASDATCLDLDVSRRKAKPTRKTAPSYPPELSVEGVGYHSVTLRFHDTGSAGSRARAENAIGVQIAVVDATTGNGGGNGEADKAPIKSASRSPVNLDTTDWPAKVRLYARWETQRKEFSPWSGPQLVTVM